MTHDDSVKYPPLYPGTLRRPNDGVQNWYLDLKDWIGLAKARLGRDAGGYSELYPLLLEATQARNVRVVLSMPLWHEISRVKDPRQREDLAQVVGEITAFEYLAGAVEVTRLELEESLNVTFGDRVERWGSLPLIGGSLLHAFGRRGGLRISGPDGIDLTPQVRRERGEWLADLERIAEHELLRGPVDASISQLRASGYRPEIAHQRLADNLEFEVDLAAKLIKYPKMKSRIRDVVTARHMSWEISEMLTEELGLRHRELSALGDQEEVRAFMLRMPSARVTIDLKASYHRDAQRRWSVNDLHDIAAMSVAVPYCDVVMADSEVWSHLTRSKLGQLMSTQLPKTPVHATEILRECAG